MPAGKRIESVDDLDGAAVLADVIAKINELLAALRDADLLDE